MADEKIDQKMTRIVGGLLEKSRAGKIMWEPAADEDSFRTSLSGYYAIVSQEGGYYDAYSLILKDDQDRVLEAVSTTTEDPNVQRDLHAKLKDLYEIARRSGLNVTQALDQILERLTGT